MPLLYFGLLQLKPGCLESFHFLKAINLQHKTIALARLGIRCMDWYFTHFARSLAHYFPTRQNLYNIIVQVQAQWLQNGYRLLYP